MKISWHISVDDAQGIGEFYEQYKNSKMVKNRGLKYRRRRYQRVTKPTFWRASILGLVTSQQPSGPGTNVRRFLRRNPFPLTFQRCERQESLRNRAERTIREAGLRFSNRLADMVVTNFDRLNDGLWEKTDRILEGLRRSGGRGRKRLKRVEREAAEFIDRHYKGFGPKQSRNILQYLGLTKYEIPLDSRLMKWLNDFGWPVTLSAAGLADRHYYNFVLDGFQELCEKSGIAPYLLDVAIFTSYDNPAQGKS